MTKKPDNTMFHLQKLVSDLASVDRNHHRLESEVAENDVEHSYSVALLCWYLHEKLNLKLDLGKLMKYALIHDFVEVYAGDVNAYASKQERKQKVENEAIALERLTNELELFTGMTTLLKSYEEKGDEESKFVWTVDKMQALILADMDGWRPYKKLDISYDSFLKKHSWQLSICSSHCREIFSELFEYCKTTFYARPTN